MRELETHPRGTHAELIASRALAREIEEIVTQFGKVVPHSVYDAYLKLNEVYKKQLEGYYD